MQIGTQSGADRRAIVDLSIVLVAFALGSFAIPVLNPLLRHGRGLTGVLSAALYQFSLEGLVPLILILWRKERPSDFGLTSRGLGRSIALAVALAVVYDALLSLHAGRLLWIPLARQPATRMSLAAGMPASVIGVAIVATAWGAVEGFFGVYFARKFSLATRTSPRGWLAPRARVRAVQWPRPSPRRPGVPRFRGEPRIRLRDHGDPRRDRQRVGRLVGADAHERHWRLARQMMCDARSCERSQNSCRISPPPRVIAWTCLAVGLLPQNDTPPQSLRLSNDNGAATNHSLPRHTYLFVARKQIAATDRVRFELTIPGSPVCRFSRPVPSATRPPVQHPSSPPP